MFVCALSLAQYNIIQKISLCLFECATPGVPFESHEAHSANSKRILVVHIIAKFRYTLSVDLIDFIYIILNIIGFRNRTIYKTLQRATGGIEAPAAAAMGPQIYKPW
jgi:hypothetical protein